MHDVDQDGYLTVAECRHYGIILGKKFGHAQEQQLKERDKNGDGQLDFNEYIEDASTKQSAESTNETPNQQSEVEQHELIRIPVTLFR